VLAMQLAHAKRQAEISGGELVTGAVITVRILYFSTRYGSTNLRQHGA
jgi:molecular chaperone DnaK (HSP70)